MSLVSRILTAALLCLPFASLSAQTNVLTQHNDIGRTGQNVTETILTPANVSSGNFGLLTSLPLDGPAFAQPLYMTSLNIAGVDHSVVFVATNHDSIYAWDAGAGGALLWKASLFDTAHGAAPNAIPDPVADTGCAQVNGPEYGVMSTPVIDPATNTMYVVSRTYEGNYPVQRLHALDVTTGAEKFGGPVTIQATVAGTGSGSVNGQLSFDPKWHMQRPGLLLLNGTVYIAFGSMCDFATWHGWVMGYNAATLSQTAAFITSPNGAGSGVWMSGAGLAADNENGVPRIFTTTGNGTFDATAPYGTNTMDFGDDFVTLNVTSGIKVTDTFTPSNQLYLEQNDVDVSSGGVVVLPDNLPGASVPHEAVQMSKAGVISVLNRDNLGGYNSTDQVLQEFNPTAGGFSGLWGMPAYWNNNVYVWPSHAVPKYNLLQFQFQNGLLSTTPVAISSQTDTWQNGQFLGASPSVSANQNSNGILWVADTGANLGGAPQYFYALDATNVANTLWSSTANARDNAGIEQHCVFPTIADGRVFLEASGKFLVYGLLDFTMTPASSVAVNPGNNTLAPITLTSSTSFTQGVTFSASQLPSGVSVSFSQASTGAATAAFTAAANAATGTGNITITGTRGTTTEKATVALTVGGLSDFILGANPVTVDLGTTGFGTVTVTPQNGFQAVPSITVSSVAAGLTASLNNCTASGCTFLIAASPTMTPGTYPVTIQATSGTLVHNATATVTVTRTAAVDVDMSKFYNASAIATDGTAPANGGLDGGNYAFSGTLLGSSVSWAGTTFKLGPANAPDAVENATVMLPSGNFVNLQMLASGGGALQQPVTVTYSDGSTSTFTQSFSNWGLNGAYSGESVADSMAYRVVPGGATQNGPWYLYGYTFALNSLKTVQSITLPPTSAVVVLAMALSSSSATAQTIVFPGIGAQQSGTSLTLNATTSSGLAVTYTSTPTSVCTVSGSTASLLASGTCSITANQAGNALYAAAPAVAQSFTVGNPAQTAVNLSSFYNVYAIANNGVAPANGGFDTASYAYSETLLGASLTALGVPFTLGPAGAADAVSGTTISLPAGSYSSLNFLAAAAFGNFANQNFVLTYTDGSTSTYTQSISDWCTPQAYPGETIAASTAYRVSPGGATQALPCDIYAYSIPIASGKTAKSIALPSSRNIVVLGITMATQTAATPVLSPVAGAYAAGQVVTITDATPSASIYYTTNGSTPTSASTLYSSPLSLNASESVAAVAVATGFANSAIAYAAFTINGPAAAPTFSVPGGSYTSAQTVSLSDATAGAKIYYTTNGTTPTTVSTLYVGPIAVSANETISALATAPNYATSTVSTATYSFAAANVIAFTTIGAQTVGKPLTLTATATSGLAVSYASSTTSVCTVSNATATFVAAGTCTLTASQAGNSSYSAATPITQSFTVQAAGSSVAGYDVVLLVGQSNMVGLGTGTDDAGDAAADPRIVQWNAALGAIRPAYDPLVQNSPPYNIGMGTTFAKAYVKHMAPNRKLLLVGAATGATGFAGGYWLPPSGSTAGGTGATTALSWANAAMAAAGANANFVGILWHQGENDIADSGASAYETNLLNLISYFRTSITGASATTPFVVGEMVNPWLTYNLTNSSTSAAGQITVLNDFHTLPDTVPYTAWTSASQLVSDPYYSTIHFSALSQRQLGRRYADKFFEAQNNLPQPQVSQKWWAGVFYDDGRGLGSANTNAIPVNNPATITGTVTAAVDPVRGNVAKIAQGNGYLSYQVPGTTFNGSYSKMIWFLPGATGAANNLISANNSGQIHYLYASNQGSGNLTIAAGHSSGTVSNLVSAQVTNTSGGWMNIALVYNASAKTMTLYLNGAVLATQTGVAAAPSSSATTLPVFVGSYGTAGYGVDGEVAGSRVWSTALTAAQVSSIYNYEASGTGNEPGFGIVIGAASQAANSPASPGFAYNVPALAAIASGTSASLPVTIVPNNGFTGSPTLALSGLPAGASYTLTAGQAANAYTLQIKGLPATSVAGGYPLVLSGTSSTVSAQAAAALCLSVPDSSGNVPVDLSCFFNRGHNLVTDGFTFTDGGLAGIGFGYSANLLGTTVTSGGVKFSLGAPNGLNGLSVASVNLPAGQYSSLALLGAAIGGAQAGQTFTVTYSDGTTSTFTQSLSDWGTPANYAGETVAASMAYADASNGTKSSGTTLHLYSYSFALNNAKTVASVTTPLNANVVVMAMTLKH